ncbi:hypothetical protein LUZ60_012379 [Juncus effusus]|nr:hypothetical protein LUZ60_012379 [Juncus effusus]
MQWFDLKDTKNGMKTVFIIMAIEWFVFLFVAIYSDRNTSSPEGTGNWNPLLKFFFRRKRSVKLGKSFSRLEKGKACVDMEPADVIRERELVEEILKKPDAQYSVVCNNLIKVHKGQDGNPDKMAVRGLSLALPCGECFGMLGPNGAGKTTLLNMLTGFSKPTAGTAYISGLDIRVDMNRIYAGIGVCPQHDLLWETLTAREHLLFYGRLKNLTGSKLTQAVHESLKSVNLTAVADKQAGQYSGGMKRRLSVAISLIGDSKVVYLDEPSTGLDPASRKLLWQAVMHAKQNRAIILTTHSMEEAEFLCDRLGIFVDGSLQCVGNPKELKAKYGGLYVLTITSSSHQDEVVENQVKNLSPTVKKIYHISGTQKFEMQKTGIRISDIFQLMENMKKRVNIIAWGVADTTLEDVFIKVAREAEVFSASNDVK